MNPNINELDVVATLEDLPGGQVFRGDVGTVVDKGPAGQLLIEFADGHGRTVEMVTLDSHQVLKLRRLLPPGEEFAGEADAA